MPVTKAFKDWTYQDVAKSVEERIKSSIGPEGYKSNEKFVEDHDHWQDGTPWPGGTGAQAPIRAKLLQAVQPQFTPVDVIGEVLDNVVNGLLSREASVDFTPLVAPTNPESAEAKALKTEADAMREFVSAWWDKQKLWEKAKRATRRARWASRGALRNWIAPTTLTASAQPGQASSLPTGLKFPEALDNVLLSDPLPNVATIVTNEATNERAAIRVYQDGEKKLAEIWYVDGENTTLRVIGEQAAGNSTFSIPIGGRLPIAEMEASVLITEPIRRQQNRLNFFETILVRVGETAGFAERYTLNAKPQGVWLKEKPQDSPALETYEDGSVTWYLHPAPRTLGAAITTDLRGITTKDQNGNETVATPGVTIKEPTDPEYAIKAAKHARQTILHGCKQGHLAPDSTQEASGIAYQQARAAFEADLANTKGPLEGLIREIIECAIALAELMSGVSAETSFLKKFRCVVTITINAGPITADEKTSNAAMVEQRMLSRASGMAANGVEDVAAELAAIDAQPEVKRETAKAQAEAIKALTDAGSGIEQAAISVGMTTEDAAKLAGSRFTQPPPAQ